VELEVEDLMAKCFQHEIDHLNGIRYVDRVLKDSLRPIPEKEDEDEVEEEELEEMEESGESVLASKVASTRRG
jgi:hypothetical protein